MKILGIDQAVTESGYCILEDDNVVEISSYKPKTKNGFYRIIEIRDFFEKTIKENKIKVVAIEGYAFGREQKAEMMGELGGMLKYMLYEKRVPLFVIPPTKLKKFATGKGNANKTVTIISIVKKWDPPSENEHALESFVLANMCYNYYRLNSEYSFNEAPKELNNIQKDVMKDIKPFDFKQDR